MGYPTSDVFTTRPYDDVSHSFGVGEPVCLFQNGALSEYSVHGDWLDHATMTPDQLLDVLWHRIDTLVHQSPDNIGLHPGKGLDDVSDNAPGFWTSRNRVLRVHVDGFHDNGLVLPDTDFTLSMDLLFYTDTVVRLDPVNAPNTHLRLPTTLNFVPEARVVVAKMGSSVTANGVSSGAVASGVLKAVEDAFAQPLPVSSDAIPLDYFIGLVVLQDGSLSLWFVNSPQGRVTADLVQQAINNLP